MKEKELRIGFLERELEAQEDHFQKLGVDLKQLEIDVRQARTQDNLVICRPSKIVDNEFEEFEC